MLLGEPYNYKTDIWALGCILYEMIAGNRAFDSDSEVMIRSRITTFQIPKLPAAASNSKIFVDIYDLCMQKNQNERPTVTEILDLKIV